MKRNLQAMDVSGQIFGRLTAIQCEGRNPHRQLLWSFVCNGKHPRIIVIRPLSDVLRSFISSCGCLLKETQRATGLKNKKHGMYGTPPYCSWAAMKSRCDNKKHQAFINYGGRGIGYDPKWKIFNAFWKDMGGTYKNGLEIDRINNDKGYSKNNCRWVTSAHNSDNRRNTIRLSYRGKTQTLSQWAQETQIKSTTIWHRIYTRHWTVEKALTTKVINLLKNNDEYRTKT